MQYPERFYQEAYWFSEAAIELHAASLAVLKQVAQPEVQHLLHLYWRTIMGRYERCVNPAGTEGTEERAVGEDSFVHSERLQVHLDEVEARADRLFHELNTSPEAVHLPASEPQHLRRVS